MATKLIEMAKHDVANAQRFVTEMVEVEIVQVTIRNRDRYAKNGRILNDVICGQVKFKPGEVKTLEISAALATELKKRADPPWELTTAAPSLPEADDEEAFEEVDTEADDDDEPVRPARVPRVQRRKQR